MYHTTERVDLSGYLGFIYFVLLFYCIYVVFYYAEPGFPWHSYLSLSIGYYCSFGILLLVPIDIASCIVNRRNLDSGPVNYQYDITILQTAYNVFFTMVLILGSFVLLFEEYYNTDGYFTVIGKLCNSFKRMTIDMAAMIVVGLIVLGVLIGEKVVDGGSNALLLTAVLVTNGVYEVLFILHTFIYPLILKLLSLTVFPDVLPGLRDDRVPSEPLEQVRPQLLPAGGADEGHQ